MVPLAGALTVDSLSKVARSELICDADNKTLSSTKDGLLEAVDCLTPISSRTIIRYANIGKTNITLNMRMKKVGENLGFCPGL
jgi:hypothetical protein